MCRIGAACALALLWVLMSLRCGIAAFGACEQDGEWADNAALYHQAHVHAARLSLVKQTPQVLVSWHHQACVAQTAMHSCYAHGDEKRARAVEGRQWRPRGKAGGCRAFFPADLLQVLAGRRLLLYGDSVMMQVC